MEALLDGEAEAITRVAVDKAKEGDTTALRLCLERILPPRKDRPGLACASMTRNSDGCTSRHGGDRGSGCDECACDQPPGKQLDGLADLRPASPSLGRRRSSFDVPLTTSIIGSPFRRVASRHCLAWSIPIARRRPRH